MSPAGSLAGQGIITYPAAMKPHVGGIAILCGLTTRWDPLCRNNILAASSLPISDSSWAEPYAILEECAAHPSPSSKNAPQSQH